MENNKHAYLIIAHNNFFTLEKLISLIDNKNNDIYIHIDKKIKNFDFDNYKNIAKQSKVYFAKRLNVNWGAYSMTKAELLLLEQANKNYKYQYYHIISGVDLPIKTQEYIHNFFNKNYGKEFIHFAGEEIEKAHNIKSRLSKYYLFQGYQRSKSKYKRVITNKIRSIFLRIQNVLKINRLKNTKLKFSHGANWCSITNNFTEYILEHKKEYLPMFKFTYCADELFFQTIFENSPYKNNLYYNKKDDNYISCMRYIDWTRGQPYTFKENDFEELINSEYLFARKFDENIDINIINKIYKYISSQKGVK